MTTDPKQTPEEKQEHAGEPVAQPSPPMDGPKPIPEGAEAVEKFNVTTDTGGGE